ncbi:MAG: hypothetical protein LC687_05860 [Actinobacteria bacterium]|nr:hypothetical protein [Actinomycetota bacterium]
MDYDDVMLYVKAHPDCSSLDLSEEFGVTVAKAFTFMNYMIGRRLVYKTLVRSPTNNKKILGYRVIPGFDELDDNGDGSMKREELVRVLRRCLRYEGERETHQHVISHNEWRVANGIKPLMWKDILL